MLKSLLERLFRTMCPLVFTGPTHTDYEVSKMLQITAPYDGWALLLVSEKEGVSALTLHCAHIVSLIPCVGTSPNWGAVYVPCRKGQTITATVNGEGKPTLRIIRTALPE